ncbi:hypothetical protein [Ponticoccus sp. (in: a-proteobacteria)]|uniref:hypothetical protein n=1 Tax=Ponticoccus sp. (in: a-proteobacteria) TaxID=1925025 RepID=UPI003AB43573
MHRAALALVPLLAACSAQARDGLARDGRSGHHPGGGRAHPRRADDQGGALHPRQRRPLADQRALAADNVQGRTGIADDIVTDVLFRDGTRNASAVGALSPH